MQFSATTIVLAVAYLSQMGAAVALPGGSIDASSNLVKREEWRHCACQYTTGGRIDPIATAEVAQLNSGRWHLGS